MGKATEIQEYPKWAKELFKQARVAILVPVFAQCDFRFVLSLSNLIGHMTQHGVHFVGITIAHRSKTVAARNRLVNAIKDFDDITHLLWLDDDHTFKPNLACNLLSRNKDYICPLQFQKIPPFYPTVYQVSENDKHGYHCYIKWPRAIFEISASGFGAVLMKKNIIDRMKMPYFEEKTGGYGQDLHFCSKLRDMGIHMFCDGTQDINHLTYVAPETGIGDFMKYQDAELAKVKSGEQPMIKENLSGIVS